MRRRSRTAGSATGTRGTSTTRGTLFLRGRLKEIISGARRSRRARSTRLARYPAVGQVVTFAVPHPTLGEDVAAAVVLADGTGASVEEIGEFAGGG